jgi:DnaJ-class molecular chaperone
MDIETMLDMAMGRECGYEQCSHCNGYGSSLKESAGRCTVCGGSGMVKKGKEKDERLPK